MRKLSGQRIKYFFKETFRPHSKDEYAEVFTRGLKENCGESVARKLPWLYIRVFALNLILFAVLVFSYRLARYSADYVTAILFGGLLFNIPLFVFFYELYPKRDFSMLKLFAVLIIGGVLSTVIIVFGYEYIYSTVNEPNVWISTLWVGFWEELVKGAVAIATIALLRKRNPFLCFLIGFAVGTGYSFTEDLGYIYSLSRSSGIAWLVLTSIGRGLSCVCSHAPWTAMICWAFAKFKKPFINFRFYGVMIAMMALHYFADVPFFDKNLDILRGITVGWVIEAAVVISIFVIVFFALKSSFKEIYSDGKPEYPQAEILSERAKLLQAANLTATVCAAAMCVFVFAGCSITAGERAVYKKIYDDDAFIGFVQQGLVFNFDLKRKYNAEIENYSEFFSEGVRRGATQKVSDGEYDYFYVYAFGEDETPVLTNLAVKVDNDLHYLNRFLIYEDYSLINYGYPSNYRPIDDSLWGEGDDNGEEGDDGEEPPVEEPPTEEPPVEEVKPLKVVSFFNISSARCKYSLEEGCFEVATDDKEFVGLGSVISLAALFGTTLIGGGAAFITLKIKARRKEDA